MVGEEIMTIQEYMKIAVLGFPKEKFLMYRKFFTDMKCEYCIYNGCSCRHPETDNVCIEYCVGEESIKLKKWW